jgi:hypothetical protein
MKWWFYLLCVVQSLWLDLSHSKSSTETPLHLYGESLYPTESASLSSFWTPEALHSHGVTPVTSSLLLSHSTTPSIPSDETVTVTATITTIEEYFEKNILSNELIQETISKTFLSFMKSSDSAPAMQPPVIPPNNVNHASLESSTSSVASSEAEKCVHLKNDGNNIEICFDSFSCTDFLLSDVSSEYKPPTAVAVSLEDLSVSCSADWSLTLSAQKEEKKHPHEIQYSGTCGISISGFNSAAEMDFVAGSSTFDKSIDIPKGLKIKECTVNPADLRMDVFFSGGAIGNVLDRFLAPVLSKFAVDYIDWILCDLLSPAVGRLVSKVIENSIDPHIENVMSLGQEPAPLQQAGYFSWPDSLLYTVHQILDVVGVNEASLLKCVIDDGSATFAPINSAPSFSPLDKENPSLFQTLHILEALLEGAIKDIGQLVLDKNSLSRFSDDLNLGNFSFDVTKVSIHGLKTLSNLELFYPSSESNVTLNSSLAFDSLVVVVEIQVSRNRLVRVSVQLKDIIIDLGLVVALKSSAIDHLYLDQVFHLPCLLSTLEDIYVSSLMLHVDVDDITISEIQSTGSSDLDDDMINLINNMIELVVVGYPAMTTQLLTGLFQGPVKVALNSRITVGIEEFRSTNSSFICDGHVMANSSLSNWILWPNSTFIQGFNRVVNDLVGPKGMNNILSCLTGDTNSVQIHVPLSFPVFSGWNITIAGLNSFYEFAIFSTDVQSPYDLITDLALGGECGDTFSTSSMHIPACVPLNITIKGYEHNHNYVDVKLSVKNVQFLIDMLFEVDRISLSNMQVVQARTEGCVAGAIDLVQFVNCKLHASSVDFYFIEETELIPLTSLVNDVFDALFSTTNLEAFNRHITSTLLTASEVCDAGGVSPSDISSPTDDKNEEMNNIIHFFRHTWRWKVVVLIVGTLVSFFVLLRVYYRKGVELDKHIGDYHVEAKHDFYSYSFIGSEQQPYDVDAKTPVYTSTKSSDNNFMSNNWIQCKLQGVVDYVYSIRCGTMGSTVSTPQVPRFDALIGNETLPLVTRLSVVLLIVIIMYTFAISEIPSSPAALVIMEIDMGGQVSPPITVFKFGLAETIREMWQAEVYFLAILIAFFTGGWPYIKMVAMFLAWILPSSLLSIEWRNSLLVWLDLLGKWSLVDSFVMMVMMVGFNFGFDIVPGVNVQVTVNPQWGFYAFLLATAASLAVGHFVLACHRLCSAVAEKELEENAIVMNMNTMNQHDDAMLDTKLHIMTSNDTHNATFGEEETGHLYSKWNNEDICLGVEDVEVEALMDHVFSVHFVNYIESSKDAEHNNSENITLDDSANSLTTKLMSSESRCTESTNVPVIHLSDLAEWNFEPGVEPFVDLLIRFTTRGKVFMIVLFALSTILVLGGTCVPVIEFDFIGLTGYLMDEPITSYSLVDIGFKIPEASGHPHDFGVLFIQIIYFLFGIGVPIVFFAFLCGLYVTPFSLSTFRGVVVLAEVLNAWAALDVLVVSGVASVLEIRRFAQFMLGEGCDEMNAILRVTMDETLEGNDTCFDVIASMKQVNLCVYRECYYSLT